MGKYLAMVTVIAVPECDLLDFPADHKISGNRVSYSGLYLNRESSFLLGCVYAAIGMFLSSLTESQIIAFISTFGILLVLYLWDGILSMLPGSADQRSCGDSDRFDDRGVLCMAYDGECGIILRDRSGRSSCGSHRICCKAGTL